MQQLPTTSFSPQMHPLAAQSHPQQSPINPPQAHIGFVPFSRLESSAPNSNPSLTLSLEQPLRDPQLHHHPEPLRPSPVRAFDLQQPLAQPDQSVYSASSAHAPESYHQISDLSQLQQHGELHHFDNRPSSSHDDLPAEHGDDLHLQLVPASEFVYYDQVQEQQYPLPLATHDAVIQDKELFTTTLDNFLAALGTTLTIPKVGGKEMDLHAMYRETTARGGIEQVIRNALWKELNDVLGLSIPAPSASFFLRKNYFNLLYHYEQVYYFRMEGKLQSPPVPLPAPSPVVPAAEIGSLYEVPPEVGSALKKRKKKLDPMQVFGVDPAASVGTIVTGAINGKFDDGYLVTVVVGREKLTGVLYHVSADKNIQQFASVPSLLDGVGKEWDVPGLEIQLGKKKKEPFYRKDPNAPKRTRTGYNIFFKEQRARLRQLHPEKYKEISKIVIEMWNRLPEHEKSLYVERGQKEREMYKKEYLEYEEKMRLESQIGEGSNGAGLPLAEHDHGTYDGSHDYHVSFDVEGDMMSFHGAQPQVSGMDDELQPGRGYPMGEDTIGYHVDGSQSHISQPETSGAHLESEQAYEMLEQEGYTEDLEEPVSEEEGHPDVEEPYSVDEDETAYPGLEQGYDRQDGGEYPVSVQAYNVQSSHVTEAHESQLHGGSAVSEQPYYVQGHAYVYPSSLHQEHQVSQTQGSAGLLSAGQVAYKIQDMGQVFHPHSQQSHPEASGDAVRRQQFYRHDGYVYAHVGQGQTLQAAALGVPVSADKASYHGQDQGYLPNMQHQNQSAESNAQTRQEQAYKDGYPYPMHLAYTQAYAQPHAYPIRFPHAHSYPLHLPETQTIQYGHAFTSPVPQSQAFNTESSGVVAPSQQLYQGTDGGQVFHAQEDGQQSLAVYKHGSYG